MLGVIPFTPTLSYPTIEQILEETSFDLLCGKDQLETYVSRVVIGAMRPASAVKYIVNDSLLITPGDSEDMVMAALECYREDEPSRLKLAGIILSGGMTPEKPIMDLLLRSGISVLIAKTDTYTVASMVHDLTVKIRPKDGAKIKTVVKLIKDHVNLDKIIRGI